MGEPTEEEIQAMRDKLYTLVIDLAAAYSGATATHRLLLNTLYKAISNERTYLLGELLETHSIRVARLQFGRRTKAIDEAHRRLVEYFKGLEPNN